jgi:HK97 family phage portal protein
VKILSKIRTLINLALTDEKAWNTSLWNLTGTQSLSGETVTEQTALTYSAVWNAVSLISGTIASLPLHLMQRNGDTKRVADERRIYDVMHGRANEYMTAMAFRETMMAHILVWGNGYAEIDRNGYGEVVALWPIAPNRINPKMKDGKLVYDVNVGTETLTLSRDRILHVPGLGFDGFVGYSVIAMARKSIGLGMALETFGSNYFGQGTHPGVIVSHPHKLDAESHAMLKNSLTNAYSGLGKSHRLMLLENGMKLEKLGIPPNDSQFLETRQFQIPDIARWFNLPPHKLKDLTRSSFNNIESEQISFVTDSILPWIVRLEQNYNMQLLTDFDRNFTGRGRYYFKHILEGLLRGDAKSRGEFYAKMFGIGAMSVNEIREKEDMDPVTGGDIYLVPLNMTTLENAGKPQEPKPTPAVKELTPPEKKQGEGGDNEEVV